MRNPYKTAIMILFVFVLALALAGAWSAGASSTAHAAPGATTAADEELAYIDPAGFINIVDPQTPSNPPFYRSPSGGYTDMATIDTNGDGVDEIIAIAGGKATLLVPFNTGGTLPQFNHDISNTGAHYISVSAGDFIPGDGGRQEIVLQSTNNSSYTVRIWDGNDNGTAWTLVYNQTFGGRWLRLKGGDIDGYEGDELVMMRNADKLIKIISYVPGGTPYWDNLWEHKYSSEWIDLALGNTHIDNGDQKEVVTTRKGHSGQLSSFLVFQYINGQLIDAPNAEERYNPDFFDIAVGDVNGSGDDEVFIIRDPINSGGVSLLGRNWGADYMPSPWELSLGRDLKAVEMGDVDGDGKAEVVVAKSGSYRVYWNPDLDFNNSGDINLNLRQPVVIQLGDFDGSSAQPPVMQVAPTALGFTMTRADPPPPAQTFQVRNIGGGIINVHVDSRVDWLQVTPFDAATPATFTVQPKSIVSSMDPGTYDATITVTGTSPNGQVIDGTQTVNVRLTISATGPSLGVTPDRYDFNINFGGVVPTPDPLQIRNLGDGGPIPYHIQVTTSDGSNWLRLSKYSGNTDDTVQVTLAPQNLPPGDYTAMITVTTNEDIPGSPAAIPVTLHIEATGMVVTPAELFIQVFKDQPAPLPRIHIDQSAPGSGAIHWYAYVVPSGDWWGEIAPLYANGHIKARHTNKGLLFTEPDGTEHLLQYIPWMSVSPDNGLTPGLPQVIVDPAQAPVGKNRVTILVDGGPDTPNRFQGVDVVVVVAAENGATWLPVIYPAP